MSETSPTLLPESRTYVIDKGVIINAVPVNPITEFWLTTINTLGALYEADYVSV